MNYSTSIMPPFQRLRKLLEGGGARQMFFSITSHCNANCSFCGFRQSVEQQRVSVSLNDSLKALDHMSHNNFQVVSFTGGEPLLHSDLPEMIAYAGRKGMVTRTGTNGIHLNEALLERFVAAGLGYLWISIDSDDPNLHDRNRGHEGLFAHSAEMARAAQRLGLTVGAGVAISHMIRDYGALVHQLADSGFSRVTFAYPGEPMESSYIAYSQEEVSRYSDEELAVVLEDILSIKQSNAPLEIGNSTVALEMMVRRLRYGQALSSCYAGSRLFYLDWNLRLFRCYTLGDYGSLFDFDFDSNKPFPCDKCTSQCFRDNSLYYPAIDNPETLPSLLAWTEMLASSQNPLYALRPSI